MEQATFDVLIYLYIYIKLWGRGKVPNHRVHRCVWIIDIDQSLHTPLHLQTSTLLACNRPRYAQVASRWQRMSRAEQELYCVRALRCPGQQITINDYFALSGHTGFRLITYPKPHLHSGIHSPRPVMDAPWAQTRLISAGTSGCATHNPG